MKTLLFATALLFIGCVPEADEKPTQKPFWNSPNGHGATEEDALQIAKKAQNADNIVIDHFGKEVCVPKQCEQQENCIYHCRIPCVRVPN